ncbi:hypothetical protein GUC61_00945, partial [Escherichia coli]|nr:hypothetical protein [Escherichia coli]
WTADGEAGNRLQAKGAKPAARPQETSVADEAPEVTATVISMTTTSPSLMKKH